MFEGLFGKKSFRYKCSECGKTHIGSPSFSLKYPPYFFDVPENQRNDCVQVSEDLCKITPGANNAGDDEIHCLRGILEIPIKGASEPFTWGVWVSQSKEKFDEYVKTFDTDQSDTGSFGWLPVSLPFYNETLAGDPLTHLECDVHWGIKGQRPKVVLWKNQHQLAVDQLKGISWKRAIRIATCANKEFREHK
ncbi:MAG: DUF2199 domain-containing protein [Aliishimia sp.]